MLPPKSGDELAERLGVHVDDGDRMALPVHGLREGGTDSAAAQDHDVHDWNATRGPWGCALCVAFTHVGTFSDASKRVLFGRALHTNQLGETLLPKRIALPVFASDALSSNGYATQEILLVLSLGGYALYQYAPWVAAAVIVVFLVVVAVLPAERARLPVRRR